MNIKDNLEENIEIYAGMTIQKRAIVDVRDCLKPSARLSIYSQYIDKLWPNKPFEKSAVSVASAMRHFYPYGDAGLYSMLARLGKPYAMRYKIEDFQGSTGDITEDDNQAAMRYTNMRLSPLGMELFTDIEKNTINKWYESYTGKEQYPAVLNSKGYYNICNGSMGLAYAIAASIPQFNLQEVNKAMEKLLLNPDIDDDEIICMPDFATGGILLNADEVKESLKNGYGHACKLRSNVEYDAKERALIFTNTPYSVYTNTIIQQLQKIKLSEENPGILNYWDQSTNDAYIKVALEKNANPNKVIKYLFKNTSLQHHYGINLTMLDNGKVPKIFKWKEALQAHIDHEKEVYLRGYEYDRKKAQDRLHILEGFVIVYHDIDTVIHIIKNSASSKEAAENLKKTCHLDDIQVKAVLAMKLSQIAKLEAKKIIDEKKELENKIDWLNGVINTPYLLHEQMIKKWREVAEKFGDPRRTQIMNMETENEEPVEVKQLLVNISNQGGIYATETSSLYTQRRGGVGTKFKLNQGEFICNTNTGSTEDLILFFTKKGNFFHLKMNDIPLEEKVYASTLLGISDNEEICESVIIKQTDLNKNILIVTAQGIIKKSQMSEYNTNRRGGAKAINLSDGDEIVAVLVTDEDKIGIATHNGRLMICQTKDINPIKRVAKGVIGIKMDNGDGVAVARIITNNAKELITVSEKGYIKRTNIGEFSITNRGTKGIKCQNLNSDDKIVDFIPINDAKDLIVVSKTSQIKVKIMDLPQSGRGAQGVKSIKLDNKNSIIGITI